MNDLSVVMITLNEEKAIKKVVSDIKRAVPEAEIIIVDSSSDKTPEIAQAMGCKVIRQYPPQGYGNAMILALTSATKDIIITLDCDDTYPAEKIPELVEWIKNGYDVVNATRLNKKPKNMPIGNYMANWFFAKLTRLVHGFNTTDVHSGMRAYKKEVIQSLDWNPNGAAFPVELLIKPVISGYKLKEIPIDYKERIGTPTLDKFAAVKWTTKRILDLKFSSK
ncbi:glycosyltransferase family 2 protein [Methanolacinia paynteri]|uniref:glycosyltransferase family 2 protein n=1 Tax=Methanolacinia paynteri TaxID=230356 RepID=UPI00064E44CD|nr:glycosyltransferase family 2 protein [Methanolacinia paynteri]